MDFDRSANSKLHLRTGACAVRSLLFGFAVVAAPAALRASGDSSAVLQALAQGPLVTVLAESSEGSARLELRPSDYTIDQGILRWSSSEPAILRDPTSGREIARLDRVTVNYVADPSVALGVAVTAGGAATTFTITSGALEFQDLAAARGRASAGFTLTDLNGDTALLEGVNPDGQAFETFYNDPSGAASGSPFATLVTTLSTTVPYTSSATTEDFPVAAGLSPTAEGGAALGTVSSMSSELHFRVSALDSASASTIFVIEPPDPPLAVTLHATSATGSAVLDLPLSAWRPENGGHVWRSSEPTVLTDAATGAEIGRLDPGSAVLLADQYMSLNFAVTNTQAPTLYTITVGAPPFTAVPNALGRASAALSLTDLDGGGATLTGENGDGQAYQAFYNDIGGTPTTGATFATLVDDQSVSTPYSTAVTVAGFGAAGTFSAVDEGGATLGSVTSMSVRFTFTLGAFDTAAATSVFALHSGGTVSGRVYNDLDGSGAQDPGEPGLAGVDVVITDSQAGISTVTTDANGDYSRVVPAGATTLDVDESTLPAGGVQTEGTDPTAVVVPVDGSASDIDGYQFFGTLSAHVFEDTNGNGVNDPGEPGLPGIDVVITDSLAAIQVLTTDGNGDVNAQVPAGSTTVDVDDTTLPPDAVLTAGTDPDLYWVAAGAVTLVELGYQFPTGSVLEIPALDLAGLALLTVTLCLAGALVLRRRRGRGRAG